MKRLVISALVTLFAAGSALAAGSCANPVSKDGKPLAGAARTSSIKACCKKNAVSTSGKALFGAARTSSINKCVKDAV
jgi:hypothetical protein